MRIRGREEHGEKANEFTAILCLYCFLHQTYTGRKIVYVSAFSDTCYSTRPHPCNSQNNIGKIIHELPCSQAPAQERTPPQKLRECQHRRSHLSAKYLDMAYTRGGKCMKTSEFCTNFMGLLTYDLRIGLTSTR